MTRTIPQQAKVDTNNTRNSVCRIPASAVQFSDVWNAYPSVDPCDAKDARGEKLFKNQCAIRVSYALKESGVTFKSYPSRRKCWVHLDADHVLAAKELADWLELQPFVGCRKSEDVTGADWRSKVEARTGIICFEDYYAPSGGSGGDHIDLWNGTRMTPLLSGLRARFNIVLPNLSDLRKSRRIRFFAVD